MHDPFCNFLSLNKRANAGIYGLPEKMAGPYSIHDNYFSLPLHSHRHGWLSLIVYRLSVSCILYLLCPNSRAVYQMRRLA